MATFELKSSIRMFQSLELSLENKTWLLETYVLISQRKQKEDNKETRSVKVNLTPELP